MKKSASNRQKESSVSAANGSGGASDFEWFSMDPRTSELIPYSAEINELLNAPRNASGSDLSIRVVINDKTYYLDPEAMKQRNEKGLMRVMVKKRKGEVASGDNSNSKGGSAKKGGKKESTMGGSKKKKGGKEQINLFPTKAIINYHDEAKETVDEEDLRNGEFDATMLYFNPCQGKAECSMTIAFRCTTKIVVGDTITIRLGGFKGGKAGVFTLESRPNDEDEFGNKIKSAAGNNGADANAAAGSSKTIPIEHRFQAYYSGDNPPKGVPPQSIILRCRHAVEENMRVVLGVPEAAHIVLPEKVAPNSTKIKIEGIIKHSSNRSGGKDATSAGKIAKEAFKVVGEVKKTRNADADIAELVELIAFYSGGHRPKRRRTKMVSVTKTGADGEEFTVEEEVEVGENEEDYDHEYEDDEDDAEHANVDVPHVDLSVVEEINQQEADLIIENAPHRRLLRMGLRWVVDTHCFHSYPESCQLVCRTLLESYERIKRSADELFLHRELAKNFGVKLSQIILLEDILYTMHGVYYPTHTRAAVMVMRLFTMEAHDFVHLFNLNRPPCIHREVQSAIRSKNMALLDKWAATVLTLSTCPINLREYVLHRGFKMPSLYSGVKDLPADELNRIMSLKAGDLYMTTNFAICSANVNVDDVDYGDDDEEDEENAVQEFTCPDTGVLFEFRGVLNAVEIGDASHYPNDKEWLLPMFSSFQVASVTQYPASKNHLIRVVLDFRGSFGGLTDQLLTTASSGVAVAAATATNMISVSGVHPAFTSVSSNPALASRSISSPVAASAPSHASLLASTSSLTAASPPALSVAASIEALKDDRQRFKMAVAISGTGGITLALRKVGQTTALTAKCIYANLRLLSLKAKHANHLLRAKYQQQFFNANTLSKATDTIEEGFVKWYYSTAATDATGGGGNSTSGGKATAASAKRKSAAGGGDESGALNDNAAAHVKWDLLPNKYGQLAELYYLKQTRESKAFASGPGCEQFTGIDSLLKSGAGGKKKEEEKKKADSKKGGGGDGKKGDSKNGGSAAAKGGAQAAPPVVMSINDPQLFAIDFTRAQAVFGGRGVVFNVKREVGKSLHTCYPFDPYQ